MPRSRKQNDDELTQEQNFDRLGILTSVPLLVDLLIYSVRPLLCLLLSLDSALLVAWGLVGRRGENVSERIVCGGF